jgi:hypothetical protein
MIQQVNRSSSIAVCKPKESTTGSYSEESQIPTSSSPQLRSQSIPISSSHFHKTASEIQLCLDEQIAELRDHIFFSRVMYGIQQSTLTGKDQYLQMQNDMCLAHIIQTRADTAPSHKPLTFPSLPEGDDWSVGLPIDAPSNNNNLSMLSMRDLRTVTADAVTLANQADEQGMIFDLDL